MARGGLPNPQLDLAIQLERLRSTEDKKSLEKAAWGNSTPPFSGSSYARSTPQHTIPPLSNRYFDTRQNGTLVMDVPFYLWNHASWDHADGLSGSPFNP